MSEDCPPRMKPWKVLKRNNSGHQFSDESDRSPISGRETGFSGEPRWSVRKSLGKVTKNPFARSSRHPKSDSLSQGLSSHPATATKANPGQATYSGTAEAVLSDSKDSATDAPNATAGMDGSSGIVQNTDCSQSGIDTINPFFSITQPLKVFNHITNGINNIHPYSKVVMSVFRCASTMILEANLDNDVYSLLEMVSEVYTFMNEEGKLAEIPPMEALYGRMARQTLECADFIAHYSETKSIWKRLGKQTDDAVKSYRSFLASFMQQCRDANARGTVENVYHIAQDLDFGGMVNASNTGLDITKCCLPGTRESILSAIKSWISSTGQDVPSVFWLFGSAGKGKSAIAHTIANWFSERGDPCACFCFDRTRKGDRQHEKIFATIARELADRDPIIRRALAHVVRNDNELRHTKDITRQWQQLIAGPVDIASKTVDTPVLIVIDALDESGEALSREHILHVLAGDSMSVQPTKFPANVRVLVTSRQLEDIHKALYTKRHIRHFPMDRISPVSAENDIRLYVSDKLVDLDDGFDETHFQTLAVKSDGLFEWARLACEYIARTNEACRDPMSRFEAVVNETPLKRETPLKGAVLLDDMYKRILTAVVPYGGRANLMFCSVMGQILALLDPLPMTALAAMRLHFPRVDSHCTVDDIIGSMGSLITGTVDGQTPIRPLHASFYDFLTDKSRSDKFFVDVSSVQSDLAFASLRVMEHELRFNICSLESSYLPNSTVPDLEKRVKASISAELSYSCQFWGAHVQATAFEGSLATEVRAFFDAERLLFWLEALALMEHLSGSVETLSSIAVWLKGCAEYKDVGDAITDTQSFVRTFAPIILHSTPHLYLSALSFSPTQSIIFQKFAAMFPGIPRVIVGNAVQWPLMKNIIHANTPVNAFAISPDGRLIACGSEAGTIQVFDKETGEALYEPLCGHTSIVNSVTISPDGNRIISGSFDMTIRVWDAATGEALRALRGHTSSVNSVAISPDGNRIVSGSSDMTIQVWDAESGEVINAFRGHTSSVDSVTISPGGNYVVSGSSDATIRVWNLETGKALGSALQGHTGYVRCVAISPNENLIVSGSFDKTIRVWNMKTHEALGAPLMGHTSSVRSIAISPDGKRVVSGSDDKTIRVWNLETGEALGSALQGHTDYVRCVAISPYGNHIVSGSSDTTIRVWNLDRAFSLQGHTGSIRSIAISPDGNRIISGSDDKTIRVWNLETGALCNTPLHGHTDYVRCVAVSQDGKIFVSGSDDNTIRVWDAGTFKTLGDPLLGHTGWIWSIAIFPDGKRIVSGSRDNMVRVWDAETGKALGSPLHGHTGDVLSVSISPDGKRFVSGSRDTTILVWDAETSNKFGASLTGHTDGVLCVAISPDGRYIVSGSNDMTVRVWDVETGRALGAPLKGHTDNVRCVAISPDGRRIVSGSDDMTIRVWDGETGKALGAPFRGHTDIVRCVAISPDGNRIVSGSDDMTIRVWVSEFLNLPQPSKASEIYFSSNPTYALHSAPSFSDTPAPLAPGEDGWVVGPEGRLLLWIPIHFHPVMYVPGNKLIIPNDASQLDLSSFQHGMSWHKCREAAGEEEREDV